MPIQEQDRPTETPQQILSARVEQGTNVENLVERLRMRYRLSESDLQITEWDQRAQTALLSCTNKGRLALATAREVKTLTREEQMPLPRDAALPPRTQN